MTPLRFADPSPPAGWIEDLRLRAVVHIRHTNKNPGRNGAGTGLPPYFFPGLLAPKMCRQPLDVLTPGAGVRLNSQNPIDRPCSRSYSAAYDRAGRLIACLSALLSTTNCSFSSCTGPSFNPENRVARKITLSIYHSIRLPEGRMPRFWPGLITRTD